MGKENKAYELGLYEKAMPSTLTWFEKLTICKESGFDYLEMSIDESEAKQARLDYTKIQRKELVDAMWQSNVFIKSICLSAHRKYPFGSLAQNSQDKALEIMEKAILLASDIGACMIQLAGYDVYYEKGNEETKKAFFKNLKKAVHMAEKHGVMLGFETMETAFMDTVEKAMEYVMQVRSPYLCIYPDIGNLKNASLLYHGDVHRDLQLGRGHIVAAHLKETIPGAYREIPFGTGHTEFESNIQVLKDLGVHRYVGEFWYCESATWKQDLKVANIFLRKNLDTVFQ